VVTLCERVWITCACVCVCVCGVCVDHVCVYVCSCGMCVWITSVCMCVCVRYLARSTQQECSCSVAIEYLALLPLSASLQGERERAGETIGTEKNEKDEDMQREP
jgi:hypothetical protein